MLVLKEDVNPNSMTVRTLTSDCKFVRREDGTVDLVREISSVKVFDHYWDRGIKIKSMWHAGGTRNPKFQQPEF